MDSTSVRKRPIEQLPEPTLEVVGRELGLRASDDIANPEMAQETGTPVSVLRWTPVYVAALVLAVIASVGLVVFTVL